MLGLGALLVTRRLCKPVNIGSIHELLSCESARQRFDEVVSTAISEQS